MIGSKRSGEDGGGGEVGPAGAAEAMTKIL